MIRLLPWTLLLVLFSAAIARADTVVLKNGDRISGTFLSMSGGHVNWRTEHLGVLAIPAGQVGAVSLEKMVIVIRRGQSVLHGSLVVGSPDSWQLIAVDGSIDSIDLASVDVILPVDSYQAIVDRTASPWQDWTGTVNLGYSIQRATQQTNTLSSSVDARRERPPAPIFTRHWRTNLRLTLLLSNVVQAATTIGSNTLSTSLREDVFFEPGRFVFGIAQLDHVGANALSLRQTYGGGTGIDLTRNGRGTLSLLAGLTFVHETFSTRSTQRTAQLLAGEKLRYQLSERVRLDHTLNVYVNLAVAGDNHFDTNTAIDVRLTHIFSFNTGLIDLYLKNPAPGGAQNTFALTTGVAATF